MRSSGLMAASVAVLARGVSARSGRGDVKSSKVGVASDPVAPKYMVSASSPGALFPRSGAPNGLRPPIDLMQADFEVTEPRGAPARVSGTRMLTVGPSAIQVTDDMRPPR